MPRDLASVLAAGERLVRAGDRRLLRAACLKDLFFLLLFVLGRRDMRHPWVLARCDEVQASPDGHLDLWARGHFKSSTLTLGKTIQDVLADPEITVGIFSHNRPIAKSFLRQIKREFEANEPLKALFPDVLWAEPKREAPSWSEDAGLVVKRRSNPKEATIEAWGIVDGQPIGRHFKLMVYDDVVTAESVTTPDMRAKVLHAWELSLNLGTRGGKVRYIGTRYHYADVYASLLERHAAIPRIRPAIEDGKPVLLTEEEIEDKRRSMGPHVFSSQILLDPKGDDSLGFQQQWLKWYDGEVERGNRYILVDPASSKRRGSDYTAVWVVEAAPDGNLYVRDLIRDRMNLDERIRAVIGLHRVWHPIMRVGWERYGMMADVEALKAEQERQGYRFEVVELGGSLAKEDRIQRLVPRFARGGVWLPKGGVVKHVRALGREADLVRVFLDEEYLGWPFVAHDDMLDALSRFEDPDLGAVFPLPEETQSLRPAISARQLAWVG